jgi:hypothetical protein
MYCVSFSYPALSYVYLQLIICNTALKWFLHNTDDPCYLVSGISRRAAGPSC